MPVHPRLEAFFHGTHLALVAAYERSARAPSNCKGSIREHAIRDALRLTLPHAARIVDGEIVDSFGEGTGQLDGILVHASGLALAGSIREPHVVLAEGVVGAIESKSDFTTGDAWPRVLETWTRVIRLRRAYDPLVEARLPRVTAAPSDDRIPFVVVGFKGWGTREALERHLMQMIDIAHRECGDLSRIPPITIVQLEKPGFAALFGRGGPHDVAVNLCDPWRAVGVMWAQLAYSIQRFTASQMLPVNFAGYVKEE